MGFKVGQKLLYSRRKKEEGRRKKEEGKILLCLSFKLLICPHPFLRLLYHVRLNTYIAFVVGMSLFLITIIA
ncbi:hypothetical protein [Okeania sp. SIO2B3]|uniref:hypothetical protein n=1 Tax=Okeania sp. SIO2B3 TaxID=2607784 RepID=UPI0013C02F17|nr:hypothetical protein [Okeania sp. SIO2B3]NET41766.1 hypothetical protein [Okeania sp. SIO2B3]